MLCSFCKNEEGQAAVEFAIIVTVLALLLTAPIDLYRYASTKNVLNNAASEALAQIKADELDDSSALSSRALDAATAMYSDKVSGLTVASISASPSSQKVTYDYRVYSSDRKGDADQFEARPSNYTYRTVELSLSCNWSAVTFWGTLFIGSGDIQIASDVVTRDVFVGGYNQ